MCVVCVGECVVCMGKEICGMCEGSVECAGIAWPLEILDGRDVNWFRELSAGVPPRLNGPWSALAPPDCLRGGWRLNAG